MAADKKQKPSNSIPIHFADSDETPALEDELTPQDLELAALDPDEFEMTLNDPPASAAEATEGGMGGPELAELIASRAELKRLQTALAEATDTAARRHADFDNYRKRVERDRG